MSDTILDVPLDDGKYRVIMHKSGSMEALRYGEPWRKCDGDGLIYSLASEVRSLREQLKKAKVAKELKGESAYHRDGQ